MIPRSKCQYLLPLILITVLSFSCLQADSDSFIFPEHPTSVLQTELMDYDDGIDPMNSRLFQTTTTRFQQSLAGNWQFVTDPQDIGEQNSYFNDFQAETSLLVPGTWNAIGRYWQYLGVAWYKRSFTLPGKQTIRVCFNGVFYCTKVWVDGELVAEHEGGYTPFSFVLKNFSAGKHDIVVRVDNSLDDLTIPKSDSDWFPFGGIHRPVYWETVNDQFIENFHVIPSDISEKSTKLNVKAFVNNLASEKSLPIQLYINGKRVYHAKTTLAPGSSTLDFLISLKNVKLWSPENPYMYSAQLVLGDSQDDQFTRFGVREFVADGYKIFLNGTRFKIMGMDHHDDHPDWGSAMPPHLIRQDIEIYKRAGANAARGHYPPVQMFLDYCDAAGLVFMNEIPAWQQDPQMLANPVVKGKMKSQFEQMVYRDMNHPSIFSWSLGNEWVDYHESYDDIKELVEHAKSVDDTHFLTFVVRQATVDPSIELVDLYCTNWHKYHWYWKEATPDSNVAKRRTDQLRAVHKRFPDKPMIITEFGGAGSQAGWHNWGNIKWSEEFQAVNIYESGEFALYQDFISGGCAWQFCDSRTAPERMLGPRLRGWNVKGVVDGYRQPKLAFYNLQKLFKEYTAKTK